MKLGTLTILTGALLVSVHGCGGRTEAPGDGTGGSATGGAPPGGQGGAPYGGGYGGGPIGGSGGGPMGGYGGGPMGGYGGGPDGGYGGMPPGGGGGPSNCGACPSFKLGGLINMAACCANGFDCGALVDKTVSSLLMLPQGCYALGQPGSFDPSCPPLAFASPIDGKQVILDGCCRAQSGTCGIYVDLTSKAGPLLGCVEYAGAGGGTVQKCGGAPGDCGTCLQTNCSAELSMCSSNPSCMGIIQCAGNCMDQACVDKCISSYPQGKTAFYGLQTCVSQKCAVECN